MATNLGPIGRKKDRPVPPIMSIEIEPQTHCTAITVLAGHRYSRAQIYKCYFLLQVRIEKILDMIAAGDFIEWRA